ncbi:hypothetical protein [Bacteroides thetaiotaomicron]|uniref:hypothetical protein n=1 Tax=Bacteroides thetaiotaomicron TaxID=818 RepID=UPI0021AB8AEC|nr:hypothetical protein [Bacteroides thetaiotaomicron]
MGCISIKIHRFVVGDILHGGVSPRGGRGGTLDLLVVHKVSFGGGAVVTEHPERGQVGGNDTRPAGQGLGLFAHRGDETYRPRIVMARHLVFGATAHRRRKCRNC